METVGTVLGVDKELTLIRLLDTLGEACHLGAAPSDEALLLGLETAFTFAKAGTRD